MDFEKIPVSMDVMSQMVNPSLSAAKGKVSAAAEAGENKAIEAASKDFESVFMAQMLKPMWDSVETNAMFGGGIGEDVMRDFLVQEYGKAMAHVDNFGLSQSVMAELMEIQSKTTM
ncbi:MAG TPA: hypothetical protein DD400_03260 [Rhodospirillaceae bacterium]|nr:hypothetical protein [Rhodospirillaceae bacterium]